MPDPTTARRAPTPRAERPSADENKLTGPLWARAVHHFYDPIFDIRSSKSFQSALNDFVLLPATYPNYLYFSKFFYIYIKIKHLRSPLSNSSYFMFVKVNTYLDRFILK